MSNPLMTPPRQRVVQLLPGDAEVEIAELRAKLLEAEAEEQVKPKRAASKSQALAYAEQLDERTAAARERAVKVTLQEVPQRVVDQLRDQHPPREDNKRDEVLGVNEDEFYWALVRAAIVDPVVTDMQWAEFVGSASPGRRGLLVKTAEDLSMKDVALPKSSAVSALLRMRGSGTTQPDDTE